jgi:serine/threonine-protein kinase HipA
MDDGTASLKLAYDVASYFELSADQARAIAREVGAAVGSWRKEAERVGLSNSEIERMASAFEHDDLKLAVAGNHCDAT